MSILELLVCQMVVVDGMLIARDSQHSHQIALMVQHCVRAVFWSKGAEQHLLPHTCVKELYG